MTSSLIEKAGMVLYKDGDNCSPEEVKALVIFVEKLIFKLIGDNEYNYDYDYPTAKEYLEKLSNVSL